MSLSCVSIFSRRFPFFTNGMCKQVACFFLQDFASANPYELGIAVNCMSNICTVDMAQSLASDIVGLLNSSRAYVRKKCVLVLYKIFLKFPEALRPSFPRIKEKLEDADTGKHFSLSVLWLERGTCFSSRCRLLCRQRGLRARAKEPPELPLFGPALFQAPHSHQQQLDADQDRETGLSSSASRCGLFLLDPLCPTVLPLPLPYILNLVGVSGGHDASGP